MGTNDEAPVSAPSLEAVDLILVLENRRAVLQLLALFRPLDKCILPESFDRKVDRLCEIALVEGGFGSHVKD